MTGWIVLLILVLLLVLLSQLPLGVRLRYDDGGVSVKVRAGVLAFRAYPMKKKKPKKEKKAKKETVPKPKPKPDLKALWPLLRELIPVGKEAMEKMTDRLRIDELTVHLIWAEEDPADAAIHYGYAWAASEAGLAFLEARFPIRRRDIRLELDYQREGPEISLTLALSLKLGHLLAVGIPAAIRALGVILQYRKERKRSGALAGEQTREEIQNGKQASCQ